MIEVMRTALGCQFAAYYEANLGGVEGFDEDEAEGEGDKGAVVLGGFLAAERHTLEAFELTNELLDTDQTITRTDKAWGGYSSAPSPTSLSGAPARLAGSSPRWLHGWWRASPADAQLGPPA